MCWAIDKGYKSKKKKDERKIERFPGRLQKGGNRKRGDLQKSREATDPSIAKGI